MRRHLMGDEKFFAGIRDYYHTYQGRNALTADFAAVMERAAGRKLDWFFNEWFYGAGYPVYEAAWHWDETAKALRLRIAQKQAALFQMPVDVAFAVDGRTQRETIEVNEREQVFTFKCDRKPQPVMLDPDEW